MTNIPPADPPHLLLALDRQETGTLLGVLAWVIGGLEIMRDRADALGESRLSDLHASLMPCLESMLSTMNNARQRSPLETAPQLESEVEAAYAEVRQAFEAWIELTAFETASAAVETHADDADNDTADSSN